MQYHPPRNVTLPGGHVIPNPEKLTVIAGPCAIESYDHCASIAEHLLLLQRALPVQFIFKSSFDKANRTSLSGKRGVGMEEGLQALAQIRKNFNLPVLTDIHLPEQAAPAAEAVDVLQIPAFLCRQTDLLIAAGAAGRPVNVKKGQFLHPEDMRFAIEKISAGGNHNILLCERGSSFGYRDLVVDMRSLVMMRRLGYPLVFDATHSVQSIGGAGGSSGGMREFIRPLLRAAAAVGVDAVFIECHEQPERAPSDGASMLPLADLEGVLAEVCEIHGVRRGRDA